MYGDQTIASADVVILNDVDPSIAYCWLQHLVIFFCLARFQRQLMISIMFSMTFFNITHAIAIDGLVFRKLSPRCIMMLIYVSEMGQHSNQCWLVTSLNLGEKREYNSAKISIIWGIAVENVVCKTCCHFFQAPMGFVVSTTKLIQVGR